MKIRTIVAATAFATTGVIGAVSQSASAGCGATVEAHNVTSSTATVDWHDSQVRIRTNVPFIGWVAGSWASLDTGSSNVAAGATATKATTLTFSCSTQRQYRLFVEQNGSTRWEYDNGVGPSGPWTTDASPTSISADTSPRHRSAR
jgi:hypothetical protein